MRRLLLLVGVLALAGAGCAETDSSVACGHVRQVAAHITYVGPYSDSAFMAEVKAIRDQAQDASSEVEDAAERLYEAARVQDVLAFERAVTDLDAACAEEGF